MEKEEIVIHFIWVLSLGHQSSQCIWFDLTSWVILSNIYIYIYLRLVGNGLSVADNGNTIFNWPIWSNIQTELFERVIKAHKVQSLRPISIFHQKKTITATTGPPLPFFFKKNKYKIIEMKEFYIMLDHCFTIIFLYHLDDR